MSTKIPLAQSDSLLIEIFTEELPPKSLKKLGEAFRDGMHDSLKAFNLVGPNASVSGFATPRRLGVLITDILDKAPNYQIREKLLPVSIAFDQHGNPTAPLLKKLSALGYPHADISSLEKSGQDKNETLYLNTIATGAELQKILKPALEQTLKKLPIAKMMHYQILQSNGDLMDVEFARPVHRIIALHGQKI